MYHWLITVKLYLMNYKNHGLIIENVIDFTELLKQKRKEKK